MQNKHSIDLKKVEFVKEQKNCLLSIEQAAKYLNISATTLRRNVYSRNISFIKIFGQYRFKLEDLDKFIADNRTPSLTEHKSQIAYHRREALG